MVSTTSSHFCGTTIFTDDYMVANYDMVPADKVTEEDEKRLKGCFAGDWYVYKVSFAEGNEKLLEEELNEQKPTICLRRCEHALKSAQALSGAICTRWHLLTS